MNRHGRTAPLQLSKFETLPVEIHAIIYGYLGLMPVWRPQNKPVSAMDDAALEPIFVNHQPYRLLFSPHHPVDKAVAVARRSMLSISHTLRANILDGLLRTRVARFEYYLVEPNEMIWMNGIWVPRPLESLCLWQRIMDTISPFAFLRHVQLPMEVSYKSHFRMNASYTEAIRPIFRQAGSIHFLGRHCPLLQTLLVDLPHTHGSNFYLQNEFEPITPLVTALKDVARRCQNLESVGLGGQYAYLARVHDDEMLSREWKMLVKHNDVFKLEAGSPDVRGDAVEAWTWKVVVENSTYDCPTIFVRQEEWVRAWNSPDSFHFR